MKYVGVVMFCLAGYQLGVMLGIWVKILPGDYFILSNISSGLSVLAFLFWGFCLISKEESEEEAIEEEEQ